MLNDKSVLVDGPIPGANYTSDTKNYPWHRPPEITDLDTAIEVSVAQLTEKKAVFGLLSMIQNGMSIAAATDIFVTSGIGAGKWTPDFAILMAGPVARIMKMLADGYGIEYRMGIEEDERSLPTPVGLKKLKEIEMAKAESVGEKVAEQAMDVQAEAEDVVSSEEPSAPVGGLMGATPEEMIGNTASQDEQDSMLGYGPTDEDTTDEEVMA